MLDFNASFSFLLCKMAKLKDHLAFLYLGKKKQKTFMSAITNWSQIRSSPWLKLPNITTTDFFNTRPNCVFCEF